MIKDLGEQDMTKQGLKLTAICLATFGCFIILDYLTQAFPNFLLPTENNAVLAFLAFISLLFESYFSPLRKLYRILKKKREMIKKAENK